MLRWRWDEGWELVAISDKMLTTFGPHAELDFGVKHHDSEHVLESDSP